MADRVRWMAMGAAAALLAVSCGAGDGDDTAGPGSTEAVTTSTPVAAPAGTPGCGQPVGEVPENRVLAAEMTSEGTTREYLVIVPEDYDPEVPTPVLFAFHGAGSGMEEQIAYSAFAPMAFADTALVVAPNALGEPRRWSPYGVGGAAGIDGVNDLDFFVDLLSEIESSFCVDTARVGATGMSSGGYMTAATTCAHADRLSMAAPVTATMYAAGACGDAAPTPYVYFHGTDDPTVPFLGPVPGPNGEPGPGSAETSAAEWAAHNGCDDDPVDERIGDDVIHRHWQACDAPTDLYIVEGGGHTWPGGLPIAALGPTTDTISASEIIWDLFQSSSRTQS